jgi:hypothetical protein
MKRLVAGAQTLITENTNTITIGQKQLTSDLDLYAANGNPDISPNFPRSKRRWIILGNTASPPRSRRESMSPLELTVLLIRFWLLTLTRKASPFKGHKMRL